MQASKDRKKKLTRWFYLVGILLCFICAQTLEAKKGKNRRPSNTEPKISQRKTKKRLEHRKLNALMGVHVFQGSALVVGGQWGERFFKKTPIYLGPEITFTLDAPSSLLLVMAGGWYELRSPKTPRFGFSFGGYLGVGIPKDHPNVAGNTAAAFIDLAIFQDVDPFVCVRGQFRPGVIGGVFAFMANLNVVFRL